MDDLIDSAQSSDLQTNRLFKLEKGVTATEPDISGDDIIPAGDRRYSQQWCWLLLKRYLSTICIDYDKLGEK